MKKLFLKNPMKTAPARMGEAAMAIAGGVVSNQIMSNAKVQETLGSAAPYAPLAAGALLTLVAGNDYVKAAGLGIVAVHGTKYVEENFLNDSATGTSGIGRIGAAAGGYRAPASLPWSTYGNRAASGAFGPGQAVPFSNGQTAASNAALASMRA